MTRLVEEDNNNNEPVILSERFKTLLEELRTIDRVSDYTLLVLSKKDGLSGRFVYDMINEILKEQLK